MDGGLDVDTTEELPIVGYEPDDVPTKVERRAASKPARSNGSRSARPAGNKRAKVSKWDRPPPPKDWRYFVGGLGQILIALGLLTFGFVAYQLWGTGIETARTQEALRTEFEQQLVATPTPSTVPVPVADLPEIVRPLDPKITEVVPAEQQTHLERVDPGAAIMRMEIPKIGVDSHVLPTVSRDDLKKGVGHFPETAMAGQLGNAAFAGHRTTYGGPFYHLDKLGPGDRVIITRLDGNQYTYAVVDTEVVDPDTYNINGRLNPQIAQLTLMTCTPVHSATNRLIIYGELVPEESGMVGEATFYKVRTVTEDVEVPEAEAETADSVTPESTSPEAVATESTELPPAQPVDGATTNTLAGLDEGDVTAEAAGDAEALDDEAGADSWSGGWFEDSDAWPQIGMWGAAVLALWILFRKIARWTRHDSIGFLVCIAPFLVSLYFFYQNVNRLLPPGI